ncbi:HpcH/HpaI aldolase family protein [Falsiroseomonas selenitidurans]|uniref:Aldolase n=1 Tax=Falsiroseomonas selenitidurans TaxID=2716335 RepID=A0ABX1EEF6_9PROT|nr:aldolase/citrate lyase family protein [Falsiroseomonas selenitidurans]NKC34302.1 aldolase [Falsiroseomonas selenitidurans]
MIHNPVRERLLRGEAAFGVMAFEFFTPGLAPVLAAGGAGFVLLDMEHSGLGIEGVKAQCAFARAAGIVPLVRLPRADPALAPAVLDAGALGIMLPLVESAAQARALVATCRYRPEGRRGLAFGLAHDAYTGGEAGPKMAAANAAVLTIALVESAAGVAAAAEIAAVPGLDLLWLGHFDLSDSLGIPGRFADPRYRAAAAALREAARAAGKPIGWVAGDGAEAAAALRAGFRALCIGHEAALLRRALAEALAVARSGADGPAEAPGLP